ncbi:MAG TPA: gamma-glutamyltransferase [Anaerolineales bacterium]|nr:gamma-glutamyltransferase [Anaerolineales bacterium]
MTTFTFNSRRSPVYGRNGMVATSQPLATAAGLEILSQGGNAADAAVAAGAALNVTEPTSTGIGGDMFALYYSAETKRVTALNGSGRAPAALTLDRLREGGFSSDLPPFHAHTITVPGACAGWFDLVERHGSLAMGEILAPAIRLARDGFPVAPVTANSWKWGAQGQLKEALNGHELTIDGRAPLAGEIFRNPNLARTFVTLAQDGRDAFYQGEIARAIVAVIREAGGSMTLDDLATHTSTWEEPISVTYRGLRVHECPPNGQGITALIALNILGGFDLSSLDLLSTERLHLMIESMRLAFADARWYVADPRFSSVPLEQLLSNEYASERRKLIDTTRATIDPRHGTPVTSSGTVYLSVVDKSGNACSFINSNYWGFGTGIVPRGFGFTLHNRGHNFRLDPGHPNALEPGKRPYHTIIPALVTREDDSLYASYGVMGGFMQPQGHVQVLSALVDHGLDPQSALDLPRFCIDVEESGGRVALEEGIPAGVMKELQAMGHPVYPVSGFSRSIVGRGQAILRDPETGVLCAGSDPRADGCAMTL